MKDLLDKSPYKKQQEEAKLSLINGIKQVFLMV